MKAGMLSRHGGLVREWTSRTLKGRYQQTLLGWLWAFIQPAAQAAVLTVVFTRLVPVETGGIPYVAFAYVAITAWTFLVSSLTDMTNAIVDNMSLVNKIYFPRAVLPVACMLARLVDFVIGGTVFVLIAAYFRMPLYPAGLLCLPVVVVVQLLLITGIGLVTAALNVYLRDVRSLLLLVTQLWLYASPVIYPLEAVPERYRLVYSLNPMVGIIEAYRDLLLRSRLPDHHFAISAAIAVIVCGVGYAVFKSLEYRFADVV